MSGKRLIFLIVILALLAIIIFLNPFRYYTTRQEREGQYTNSKPIIRSPKLISGKTDKELFAAITKPQYVTAEEASSFLKGSDKVYVVRSKNGTYAYPSLILGWHHIVNETIDQKPVAVTLCALTDTGVIDSRVFDNKTVNFGVLGSLYLGNLIMYDDKNSTPLLQMTGEEIASTPSNKKMTMLAPLEYTSWDKIKNTKDLKVLAPVRTLDFYRGFEARIATLEAGLKTLKFSQKPDTRLPAYESGLGVQIHEASQYYPLSVIQQKGLIEENVGGWNLLVATDPRFESPKIFRRYVGGQVLNFERKGDFLVDRQTQTTWDFDGNAVEGKLTGQKLESPKYVQAYWFAWAGFYPQTTYFQ